MIMCCLLPSFIELKRTAVHQLYPCPSITPKNGYIYKIMIYLTFPCHHDVVADLEIEQGLGGVWVLRDVVVGYQGAVYFESDVGGVVDSHWVEVEGLA